MTERLTIGIVGCSAEGAALCYRTICTRGSAALGPYEHPEIVMHTPSLARYVAALEVGDLEAVADLMLQSAHRLVAAGADFLICPDNTIHAAMPFVRARSPLPWLHIAEIVAAEAVRRGFRRAAVLGTRWLCDSSVYPDALQSRGMEFLRPDAGERDEVGRIIMEELVNDVRRDQSVRYLQTLIARMQERGCDTAILGCTELPIVLDEANSTLPILDSTRLLADAALARAIMPRAEQTQAAT